MVTVALAPEIEGVHTGRRVMGYAAWEPSVLHWVYVKSDYRGQGIGTALVNHVSHGWDQFFYTHRTRASAFLDSKFRFDPTSARTLGAHR